jgi:hypothetical protein
MAPGSALAKPGGAKLRSFRGTVTSVDHGRHAFRIRRRGHAGVRLSVAGSTKLGRGARLRKGQMMRVRARRFAGGWLAVKIVCPRRGRDKPAAQGDDPGAGNENPALDDQDPGLDDQSPGADDEDPGAEADDPGADDGAAGSDDAPPDDTATDDGP